MKLQTKNIEIERYGDVGNTAHEFSIDKSQESFILEILRSKMYQNPIRAICREIICNAQDANKESGSKEPVKVVLPSRAEPFYLIQDTGPGISPERAANVFVKFGSSTKRSTNDLIGGYGLGGKTPFAYTDTFNIITNVDGIRYQYTAYIDETNKGSLQLVSKQKTKDANGTTIKIPVKSPDFDRFKSESIKACLYLTPQPVIAGLDLKLYEQSVATKGQGWTLYDNSSNASYGVAQLSAVVGGMIYPIDVSSIPSNTYIDTIRTVTVQRNRGPGYWSYNSSRNLSLQDIRLVLEFPVGALELSTNRESLSYVDQTIEAIDNKIKDIIEKEITPKIEKDFQKCKTIWEAIALNNKNSNSDISALAKHSGFLKYKNHPIESSFNYTPKKLDYVEVLPADPKLKAKYSYDRTPTLDLDQKIYKLTIPQKFRADGDIAGKVLIIYNDLGTKKMSKKALSELRDNKKYNSDAGYELYMIIHPKERDMSYKDYLALNPYLEVAGVTKLTDLVTHRLGKKSAPRVRKNVKKNIYPVYEYVKDTKNPAGVTGVYGMTELKSYSLDDLNKTTGVYTLWHPVKEKRSGCAVPLDAFTRICNSYDGKILVIKDQPCIDALDKKKWTQIDIKANQIDIKAVKDWVSKNLKIKVVTGKKCLKEILASISFIASSNHIRTFNHSLKIENYSSLSSWDTVLKSAVLAKHSNHELIKFYKEVIAILRKYEQLNIPRSIRIAAQRIQQVESITYTNSDSYLQQEIDSLLDAQNKYIKKYPTWYYILANIRTYYHFDIGDFNLEQISNIFYQTVINR